MRKSFITLVLLGLCSIASFANRPFTAVEYITMWKDEAIYQMALHKIPASITLAQGLLESGNGNSRLATEGNNHFGIKCHNDWDGQKIYEDDETKGECFRQYTDARQSFEDHSLFLQKPRYQSLFELDTDDYKAWAKGLKECGYATNPKYPQLLINLIEQNNLDQYDKLGVEYIKKNELPPHQESAPLANLGDSKKTGHHKKNSSVDGAIVNVSANRTILQSDNKIQYVVAKDGDTPESIARDFDLNALFIRRFNDLKPGDKVKPGDIIYIKPKKNQGSEKTYKVKSGDTMWSISQAKGIKLRKLLKWNHFSPGVNPEPGTVLMLKRSR